MISEEIIKRAGKRDQEAFKLIYMEFKDFVWNVALKTAGNPTHAEDATAEVFIKLFKNIQKFKFKSSFKSWVYRITVNTTLNYLDKINRRKTKHLNEDFSNVTDEKEIIEDELHNKNMVNKLLSGLSNEQKVLIILREIEGLSYNEIAQSLKMNLGTVKTKIYRARDNLRKLYKDERL